MTSANVILGNNIRKWIFERSVVYWDCVVHSGWIVEHDASNLQGLISFLTLFSGLRARQYVGVQLILFHNWMTRGDQLIFPPCSTCAIPDCYIMVTGSYPAMTSGPYTRGPGVWQIILPQCLDPDKKDILGQYVFYYRTHLGYSLHFVLGLCMKIIKIYKDIIISLLYIFKELR